MDAMGKLVAAVPADYTTYVGSRRIGRPDHHLYEDPGLEPYKNASPMPTGSSGRIGRGEVLLEVLWPRRLCNPVA